MQGNGGNDWGFAPNPTRERVPLTLTTLSLCDSWGKEFFASRLQNAAKRRWESEGESPSGGFGRQPNAPLILLAKRLKIRIRERSDT